MRVITALDVYANGRLAGELLRHFDAEQKSEFYSFQYDKDADPENPISLFMPFREKPYYSNHLHTVFQSSLPEGYLRKAIIKRFSKIVYPDDMGILFITGQNRIGHLQCMEKGKSPARELFNLEMPEYDRDNEADISLHIEKLMMDFAEQSGVSGTMPKIMSTQTECVTINSKSRIIKLDSTILPFVSVNEFFCLLAARKSGMTVPDAELIMEGRGISIKRFDITDTKHRLGFEDICSLLGLSNEFRYNATSEQLARAVVIAIGNDEDVKHDAMSRLFKSTVFSHASRNGDAHLKNYGILFDGYKSAQLSPIYDLVTTTAFPQLAEDKPALKLNNQDDWVTKDDFILSGKNSYGLSNKEMESVFLDVECGLNATASDIVSFFDQSRPQEALNMMISVLHSWETGLSSLEMKTDHIKEALERLDVSHQNNIAASP